MHRMTGRVVIQVSRLYIIIELLLFVHAHIHIMIPCLLNIVCRHRKIAIAGGGALNHTIISLGYVYSQGSPPPHNLTHTIITQAWEPRLNLHSSNS